MSAPIRSSRVAFNISRSKQERRQILITEDPIIVFQNIPNEDIHTFAYVWTNCRNAFATPIEVSSKHALWMQQPIFLVPINVNLSICFSHKEIKRSHSVPSKDYTADDPSNPRFGCSEKLFDPMFKSNQSSWLIFLIFWKTTGKHMVLYNSKMIILRCLSSTIATYPVFPKKQVTICWKCFMLEQLLLDLADFEIFIQ